MSVLFERAIVDLVGGTAANDLADVLDLNSSEDARAAAIVALPVVLANMARVAQSPVGGIGLVRMTRAQMLDGVTGVGRQANGRAIPAADAVAALLGVRAEIVFAVVAERAGLDPVRAERLLGEALTVCLRSLARELGRATDRSTVPRTLSAERAQLIDDGWGVWINRCLGDGNPGDVLDLARHISLRAPDPVAAIATHVVPQRQQRGYSRSNSVRYRDHTFAWWLVAATMLAAVAGAMLAMLT